MLLAEYDSADEGDKLLARNFAEQTKQL